MQNEGMSHAPKDQALVEMVVLAFFFLLKVGEYNPLWKLQDSYHTNPTTGFAVLA